MSNKPISLSVALVGVTALGWAVACSSSPSGGGSGSSTGSSGSGSTGSNTSGSVSGSSTTGSAGGSSGIAATGSSGSSTDAGGGTPAALVIDNQTNTGGQISRQPAAGSGDHPGTWFSYVGNGAPLTQVTPPQGSSPFPFQAITPPGMPAGGPTIANAACLTSTGFQGFSVGEGMHFQAALPADAGDGGIATPVTFDATAYSGISFWAISRGTGPLGLRVKIPDDQTDGDPFAMSKCKTAAGSNAACFDDFSKDFVGFTSTWTQYSETFMEAAQHGFGGAMGTFSAIDKNAIYGVEFEVEGLGAYAADAGFAPAFDFCIAQVAFTQ